MKEERIQNFKMLQIAVSWKCQLQMYETNSNRQCLETLTDRLT